MSNKLPTQEQGSLKTTFENSKAPGYLRGVLVGGVAAVALYSAAEHFGSDDTTPDKDSAPVCVPYGNQMLQVQAGEGVKDVAYKIDGVGEGNPANDPCEPAKEAIVEQAQHSAILQQGEKLHLPIGVYPQGEVPEGAELYSVDPH